MPTTDPPTNALPHSGSQLGLLFRQLRDAMWERMSRELAIAGHELTFSQYIALKRLSEGDASASELARAADLNPGAITRLLDRLEEKHLTARIPDPDDRRALRVALTETGTRMWADIHQCGLRVRERALEHMGPDEQATLFRLLAKVRENLTREDD
ncbi:MAG: MarR family transcriptional regulator [Lysobacteraceae bacterium]